jgi:apolipoprotein D and lipocalin family protein
MLKYILLVATLLFSAAGAEAPALQAVPNVNLDRYQGTWYQIALFPNSFQKQCLRNTRAEYRLRADGKVSVKNSCEIEGGKTYIADGLARVLGDAKLEVSFLPSWLRWTGIGWGNYWVIQLGGKAEEGYRYAVVSEPKREYLWILSRAPQLSAEDDAAIKSKLQLQGFDLSRLQAHPQSTAQKP